MADIEHSRGLEAALIVAEHLPREEDGTATIMEVAQRRDVLLGYLREAQADYRGAVEALNEVRDVLACVEAATIREQDAWDRIERALTNYGGQ